MNRALTVPLLALVALAVLALYFHERRHAKEVAAAVEELIEQRELLIATGAFAWNADTQQWECDCVREWRTRRDAWLKSFEPIEARP